MAETYGWPDFWTVYHAGKWEPRTHALLRDVLAPGDLFVDVGAWIGPVTLWALELGADVIAVEPDPVAIGGLRERVPASVEIWEGAITTGGNAQLAEAGSFGDSMSRLGDGGVPVRGWTLQHVLAGRTPALVKVDVEGYEVDLCPVLMPWLADIGAVVQVSCHGTLPERSAFDGFAEVRWPDSTRGDVVALPI